MKLRQKKNTLRQKKSIVYGIDEYEIMLSEDLCALKNVISSLQKQKSWSDVFAVLSDIKFNRAPSMTKKKIAEKYGEEVSEIIEFIKNERNDIKKEITNNFQKKAGNYLPFPLFIVLCRTISAFRLNTPRIHYCTYIHSRQYVL